MRLSAAVFGLVTVINNSAFAADDATGKSRGEELVAANCARCHAIGAHDSSTHSQAPLFRTLATRYPIENLAEGLAEGFSSGHPDMPDFVFEVDDVAAILTYLQSIQEPGLEKDKGEK